MGAKRLIGRLPRTEFSLSVLPASCYLSVERGSPWPKKKENILPLGVLVLLDIVKSSAG